MISAVEVHHITDFVAAAALLCGAVFGFVIFGVVRKIEREAHFVVVVLENMRVLVYIVGF